MRNPGWQRPVLKWKSGGLRTHKNQVLWHPLLSFILFGQKPCFQHQHSCIFAANGKTEKCLFTLINCRLVIVCLGEGHTVSCFQHYMYICTSFETWRAALKFSIMACVIQRKGKTSDQSGRSSPCAADIAVAMLENWAPVKSCKVNISTIYNTGQCSGDMDNKGSVLLRCS